MLCNLYSVLQFLDNLKESIGVGVGKGGNNSYERPSIENMGLDYYVSSFQASFWPAQRCCDLAMAIRPHDVT